MAVYEFTSPEGKVYELEGPEGATQEQAFEKFKELRPELFGEKETKTSQVPYLESLISEKRPRYDIKEGAKDVGVATGLGAITGAATPEIMKTVAFGMKAIPRLQPYAPYVENLARTTQGAKGRFASATAGGFGGGVGETAGQAVEAYGGTPAQAEAARFVGGMVGPEALFQITRPFTAAGGYGLSLLANKLGFPIGTTARTIGQMLEEKSVQEANLTQRQREFVQQKINDIRGGAETYQPIKDIMGMLQSGAQQIIRNADAQVLGLENEAQKIIADAQFAGGRISQQTEQRISRLQSRLNDVAIKMRESAQKDAASIIEQSENAARQIKETAAAKAPELRAAAIQQADELIASARKLAEDVVNKERLRETKVRQTLNNLRTSLPARQNVVQKEFAAVGERMTPTNLGEQMRTAFDDVFTSLKNTRKENVDKYKDEAFNFALQKESAGDRYQKSEEFKNIIQEITNEISSPETGLARAIPEQRDQLTKVRDLLVRGIGRENKETKEIVYTPLSFDGLEQLRRQLRDRAFGLPAEGYDAISQQQAGRMADRVERIMEDFSPGLRKYLNQYREDSKPLNEFKNKLGKAMVGREEFDMSQFVTDPSKLGNLAFTSASTVNQLINTVGKQRSEEFARSFIADRVRGGTVKDLTKALEDSYDWIDLFPVLKNQLQEAAKRVGVEERVIGKRVSISDLLGTELQKFPKVLKTAKEKAEQIKTEAARKAQQQLEKVSEAEKKSLEQAEKEAAAEIQKGKTEESLILQEIEKDIASSARAVDRQRGRLETEAKEKIGKVASEAEEAAKLKTAEAAGIRSEAQKKADIVLGSKTPVDRVQSFLLGANANEWAEISPIIKAAPGGKERLADAVSQLIASRAERSLKGAIADMKLMRERLVDNGLMSKSDADKIVDRLQEVFVTPIAEKARISMAQRLVRNAIAGYAVPGIQRGASAMIGEDNAAQKR
jgi:hypothetical protein